MRRKTRKTLFALTAVLLFFFTAEILVRVGIKLYQNINYNPELHRFREMDLEADKKRGWHWKGDQLFRGRSDVARAKPAELYRIITTGDSCCWGALVPPEATFSAKLDLLLASRYGRHRVEVLNAGVVGYSTSQVLEHFNMTLKDYHPDLLIYYGTGEDSARWLRGGRIPPGSMEVGLVQRLLFQSRLYRLLAGGIERLKPAFDEPIRLVQNDQLRNLQSAVEERGGRLLLVEYLGVKEEKIISHIYGIDLDFRAPVVRTFEAFMAAGRPVRQLIFDEVHPTAAGHSIIAGLIHDEIVRLKLIGE